VTIKLAFGETPAPAAAQAATGATASQTPSKPPTTQ
jgi:hypothetical protein